MDPNLYQAARQLPAGDGRMAQLYQLAVSPAQPRNLAALVRKGLLWVAGLLLASGLIFWVAANWQEQSRMFRLGLIEAALALSVLAACVWQRARNAALLCATLVLGGLLAFVGQTYQTGADAWHLFAAWAALSLVWVAAARSDVLWLLWVLIVATGLVMWTGRLDWADVLFEHSPSLSQIGLNLGLWLLLAICPALLSLVPALRVKGQYGHIGWWSHRTAVGCALAAWTGMGMTQLLATRGDASGLILGLVVLLVGGVLWLSLRGRFQDFVTACLAMLAVNVLLLSSLARWLFESGGEVMLLIFGLVTLGCIAVSVRCLLSVQQRMRSEQQSTLKEAA